jgi:lambda family phage portal protein
VRDVNGVGDDAANDAIEAAWTDYSKTENFTTSRNCSRLSFENLAAETLVRDGEFIYQKVPGWTGNAHGFAVRPIEADYLDELKHEVYANGNVVKMGVEKNVWGEPIRYWLRTWNPGDVYAVGSRARHTSEPWTSADVRLCFVPSYWEQSRGVPWIHAGATRLKMLGGYEEAALEASRAAACKHEYITQDKDAPNAGYKGDGQDAAGNALSDIEPGTKELLDPGQGVLSIDPKYPHSEHRPFVVTTLMGVAAGSGLSYSTLTGDMSENSFSSGRIGVMSERETYLFLQAWFIQSTEIDIFRSWLKHALMAYAIKLPNGSALPFRKLEQFNRPMFNGRRWPYYDPLKDQQAHESALSNVLTSHSDVLADRGQDFEDLCRRRERDIAIAKKYGITLPKPGALKQPAAPAAGTKEPDNEPIDE